MTKQYLLTADQVALYRKYWFTERRDTKAIAQKLGVHESVIWNYRASVDRVVILPVRGSSVA